MKRTLNEQRDGRVLKSRQEALKKQKLARTMATAATIDTTQHSTVPAGLKKATKGAVDAWDIVVEAQKRKLQEDRQKAAVILMAAYRNAEELTGLDHGELLGVAAEVGTMRLRGQLA